jgi:hypothetical protein
MDENKYHNTRKKVHRNEGRTGETGTTSFDRNLKSIENLVWTK